MNRHHALVCGIVVLVLALAVGTDGIGTAALDRGVTAATSGDDTAVVGVTVERLGTPTEADNRTLQLSVVNGFSEAAVVTVTVGGERQSRAGVGPGETEVFIFDGVACDEAATIDLTGASGSVSIDRPVC